MATQHCSAFNSLTVAVVLSIISVIVPIQLQRVAAAVVCIFTVFIPFYEFYFLFLCILRFLEQLRGDMHMRVAFVWLCALQISCILSVSADFVRVCVQQFVCVSLSLCMCVCVAVAALVIFIVALIRALLHYN